MKKIICLFMLILSSLFLNINFSNASENVKNYVIELSEKFAKVNKIENKEEKYDESYKLAREYLDVDWMGNFILGKHRKTLEKSEVKNFVEVFSKYLINNYLETLSYFSKENLTFKETKEIEENTYLALIELNMDGKLVKIDLRVFKNKNGKYMIRDILPEGISFLNTQRTEVDNIITTKGYNKLMEEIKK